jgi:lysyl endopeptidase
MARFRYCATSFLIICTLQFVSLFSQIQQGGLPYSFKNKICETIPVITMRPVTPEEMNEDEMNSKRKAFTYAVVFDVKINPENSGIWTYLPHGIAIWQVGIESKGAYSLNVLIDPFKLPENATLFLYNKDHSFVAGAFNACNNNTEGVLPVMPVPGDLIYLELVVSQKEINNCSLNISKISHGYKDLFRGYNNPVRLKSAGDCNVDVNCPVGNGWEDVKNAVFRYIYYNSYNKKYEYCTGTLINNADDTDIPYFITAGHCLFDEEGAKSLVALFGYESYYCGGPVKGNNKTLSGAKIIAHSLDFDFTLGELSSLPPFNYSPYLAGWNCSESPAFNVATIHHPSGDVKKISFDYDTVSSEPYIGGNSLWKIAEWDVGVTEQGSSGAALFNNQKQIMGILSLGDAYCGFPFNDLYMKFSYDYNYYSEPGEQLKIWIDPGNTGIDQLNGKDPYKRVKNNCDTIKQVPSGASVSLIKYAGNQGYYTGHNNAHFSAFAQLFKSNSEKDLPGFYVNVAKRYAAADNSFVTYKIWEKTIDGLPGNTVFEQKFYVRDLVSDTINYIDCGSIIRIKDDFFIGYEIVYNNPSDTFAVKQSAFVDDQKNNYYIQAAGKWERVDRYTSDTIQGALDIRLVICDSIPVGIKNKKTENPPGFTLYPNPAKEYINLTLNRFTGSPVELSIYDLTGRLILKETVYQFENSHQIKTNTLKKGVYLISLNFGNYMYTGKFVIF